MRTEGSIFDISTFDIRSKKKKENSSDYNSNFIECDRPGCSEAGLYKAFVNPRNLKKTRFLCLDHVREHNKRWNFCDGMTEQEILEYLEKDIVGQRPTWPHHKSSTDPKNSKNHKKYADDFFESDKFCDPFDLGSTIFGKKTNQKQSSNTHNSKTYDNVASTSQLTAVREACDVLDIIFPPNIPEAKKKYKILVKQNHPDIHKNDPHAEKKLKKIISAFETIKNFYCP